MSATDFTRRLVEARQKGVLLGPGPEPASLEEAYTIQKLTCESLGESVAGWKVADHPRLGPIAAPIFAGMSKVEGASWPFGPGLGVEIEIALRLKRDLVPGTYTRAMIAEAIDGYSLGVELVGARLAEPDRNLFAFLGDLMANRGYVMGNECKPRQDLAVPGRACRFRIDGKLVHDAPAAPPALDPLGATAAWLSRGNDALGGLKAGQFVTTGSVCGIIPVPGPGAAVAEIEGLGTVRLILA
ncbi:MAG: hypothetical protein O9322_08110 [Beijerinckiaceae bacterium]|nr:hypothetical protein [Beijerinckiaceae bacterium]MCZ8299490.1 hypothetical protein [Beijerinckiaceae bacterium]